MLERLRMQEVSQIILSVPEGAVIAGTNLKYGEPVMIIEKPNTSTLKFNSHYQSADDAQGFIGKSGITSTIDFIINDGAVLYSVWSYIHGLVKEDATAVLKGTEWLTPSGEFLQLSSKTAPLHLVLYIKEDRKLELLKYKEDYEIVIGSKDDKYYIRLFNPQKDKDYFVCYDYKIDEVLQTKVKQIHNNIFCMLDIYFDAVDMDTDDKYTVCVHCDKVQVFTDLAIGINDSSKASFTPITIKSIAQGQELNKDIATITVV